MGRGGTDASRTEGERGAELQTRAGARGRAGACGCVGSSQGKRIFGEPSLGSRGRTVERGRAAQPKFKTKEAWPRVSVDVHGQRGREGEVTPPPCRT